MTSGNITYIANASEVRGADSIISVDIPQEVKDYATEIAPSLLGNVIDNEDMYDVSINNYSNLYLGNPYVILQMDNESQEDIYYFPVIEDSKAKLILSVYKDHGVWNASLSKDIADELNNLVSTGDSNDYILYTEDGAIYAQSDDTLKELYSDDLFSRGKFNVRSSYKSKVNNMKSAFKNKVDKFNIQEKCEGTSDIGKKVIQKRKIDSEASLMAIGANSSNPFAVNETNTKLLNMNGCKVNQADSSGTERNMCWAAVVASIVRYVKGNTSLTASDVCNKIGISMDSGADATTAQSALNTYSVYMSFLSAQCPWETIVSDISNKKPIFMGSVCLSSNVAHATTIIGYTKSSSSKTVTFWNSSNRQVTTSTYTVGPVFTNYTYLGYSFRWFESLY